MHEENRSGMVSVFSAATLVLILSMLLTLIEGARVEYILSLGRQHTEYAVQSLMSQYDEALYKQYDIYGLDSRLYAEIESLLSLYAGSFEEQEGKTFLALRAPGIEEHEYRLLTDDGGLDFRIQAATSYRYSIPEKVIDEIMDKLRYFQALGNEDKEDKIIKDAERAIGDVEAYDDTAKDMDLRENTLQEANEQIENQENPIEELKGKKKSFLLSQVLPNEYEISKSTLIRTDRLEDRRLEEGTLSSTQEMDVIDDTVLFPLYLQEHFYSAIDKKQDTNTLKYQQEYLIIGELTDEKNLEEVVRCLLLLREMSWFTYRMTDPVSRQEANVLAIALVGASGMPIAVYSVELGILMAWSYDDAVKDLRTLLAGGSVSLVPGKKPNNNQENKNTALLDKAGYEDFLLILLMMSDKETVACRALDIMEETLSTEGKSFEAAKTITQIKGNMSYSFSGVFRQLSGKKKYSYMGGYLP